MLDFKKPLGGRNVERNMGIFVKAIKIILAMIAGWAAAWVLLNIFDNALIRMGY